MGKGKLARHIGCGKLISKLHVKVLVFLSFCTGPHGGLFIIIFSYWCYRGPRRHFYVFPLAQAAHFTTLLCSYFVPLALTAKPLTLLCYLLHSVRKRKNSWILKEPRGAISARPGFLLVQTWATWGLQSGHAEAGFVEVKGISAVRAAAAVPV